MWRWPCRPLCCIRARLPPCSPPSATRGSPATGARLSAPWEWPAISITLFPEPCHVEKSRLHKKMPDLILHHYPRSPFSEKMRLVLGYKKLAWKSVVVPAIMPKPDVQALTGGYRKTPVLQVGADIYCDTTLICDVLEHVQPEPTLYPPHLKGVSRVFAQWADTTLFWASMAYSLQPKGRAHVFGKAPPEVAEAFGEDRKAMTGNIVRLRPGDATSAYRSYLRRIAHMVEEHDFLFGIDPCVADFAAYHPLWYTRVQVPVLADILGATPAVGEWMDRMAAIGHGTLDKFNS